MLFRETLHRRYEQLERHLVVSRMPSGDAEIFESIQGEGPSTGMSSSFLRLATCNLNCSWCDTKYTWDWGEFDQRVETLTIPIADVASQLRERSTRNLVVTGGEPLIQQHSLAVLCRELKIAGFRIEIETNGTIGPSSELVETVDQFNVSPKLRNSGIDPGRRCNPDALKRFRDLQTAFFKFVVETPSDLEDVDELRNTLGLTRERVVLMPLGVDAGDITTRSPWLARECIARGYRFSTRLHILLWGCSRGR
jgi:7-carboxy-7-deazaguanine synthase